MADWLGALTNRSNVMAGRLESEKDRIEREKERKNARSDKTVDRLLGILGDYQTQQNFNRQQTESERAQGAAEGLASDKFDAERADAKQGQKNWDANFDNILIQQNEEAEAAKNDLFLKYGQEPGIDWDFDPTDLDLSLIHI